MNPSPLPSVLLVGGGRMGAAMLSGWRELGLPHSVVVDPSPNAAILAGPEVTVIASAKDIPPQFNPSSVIFAIKPQAAANILPDYARFSGALFLSIMAGQTIATIRHGLGINAAIIRAMPNTPAAIRQGMSVAVAGPGVSPAQRNVVDQLLAAIGQVAWVEDEKLLDPITAISGGGPAYLFLLTELLEQAALAHGIAASLARQMARQTIIGAAGLLAAEETDSASLRAAVTSPGGTTQAALAVLMAPDAWPHRFRAAIEAGIRRSRELSGS